MTDPVSVIPGPPSQICDYPVDGALSDKECFLAIGPGGRGVVLKRMEDDCVLKGQLHPAVRERLARVRELAHGGVANLYGVERDDGKAWLIWEYVEGEPFDQFAARPERSLRELAAAGRELALAVDLLHMQGIVHGAIHGGNVIVSPGGTVRITHVSPLLYADTAQDADAVVALLESAVALRGAENSSLGWLLARARDEGQGLRALSAGLAALVESRELDHGADTDGDGADLRPRRRALYGAVVVGVLGVAGGLVAWRAAVSPDLREGVRGAVEGWFGR